MMIVIQVKAKFSSISVLRGLLLLVIFQIALCLSEPCASSSSCVLPQPLKDYGGSDLDNLLLEANCYLGCIDQVSELHGHAYKRDDLNAACSIIGYSSLHNT